MTAHKPLILVPSTVSDTSDDPFSKMTVEAESLFLLPLYPLYLPNAVYSVTTIKFFLLCLSVDSKNRKPENSAYIMAM